MFVDGDCGMSVPVNRRLTYFTYFLTYLLINLLTFYLPTYLFTYLFTKKAIIN